MRSLIIGAGEIGKGLHAIISTAHESHVRDLEDYKLENVDVLNICFPYSKKFIEQTQAYIKQYKPKITIIHATVPVGTNRKVGSVSSPVNGRHPNLAQSIKTFRKIVAGANPFQVYEAIEFLGKAGIQTVIFSSPETAELAKILCTRRYGLSLVEMKETAKLCMKHKVAFTEAYNVWNELYNEGYTKLGENRFFRPNLIPMKGKIGGHCVIPNLEFLDDELSKFIKERNETYGENEGGK